MGIARPGREKGVIMAIPDEDGSIIMDQEQIANRFRDYYAALYTSKIAPDLDASSDYLTHVKMLWLSDADRESLMEPLTTAEIRKALKVGSGSRSHFMATLRFASSNSIDIKR
ncbi:hypothetical protein NDU88_000742 [Pleurodeles waltl]|uniref:Uncharacterized protein n=1 Tax=Pleurodeles waltl TaxID=8319 RepID=A0AAV7LJE2_PLEWA|nr:hypothetical protein NDU88_000742 [Pleurodeles waltl]